MNAIISLLPSYPPQKKKSVVTPNCIENGLQLLRQLHNCTFSKAGPRNNLEDLSALCNNLHALLLKASFTDSSLLTTSPFCNSHRQKSLSFHLIYQVKNSFPGKQTPEPKGL